MSIKTTNTAPIYVRLMGGLGNQLFQYSTARTLADARGTDLVLDARYVVRKAQHSGFVLEAFDIRAKILAKSSQSKFSETKIKWAKWLKRYYRPMFNIFCETGLGVDSQLAAQPNGSMLLGFWQSEQYFSHNKLLLTDLVLKQPLSGKALDISQSIKAKQSVALHVRRGDYVNNAKALKRYGLCSVGYYQKAIAHLSQHLTDPHFYVFSDDPMWVVENLSMPGQCTFVSAKDITPEQDLILISQCKHQIIANSTFSWWGAWLNSHYDKIVVYPTPWFNEQAINANDLVPHNWHPIAKNSTA